MQLTSTLGEFRTTMRAFHSAKTECVGAQHTNTLVCNYAHAQKSREITHARTRTHRSPFCGRFLNQRLDTSPPSGVSHATHRFVDTAQTEFIRAVSSMWRLFHEERERARFVRRVSRRVGQKPPLGAITFSSGVGGGFFAFLACQRRWQLFAPNLSTLLTRVTIKTQVFLVFASFPSASIRGPFPRGDRSACETLSFSCISTEHRARRTNRHRLERPASSSSSSSS